MIVDDSALMREVLRELFIREPDLEVVAVASDPVRAMEILKTVVVDVITLDVEMPRMNGLAFLEQLMSERPVPVVMVSSLTERGSELAMRALEIGAVDVVEKPKLDVRAQTFAMATELVTKVRAASSARPRPRRQQAPAKATAPPGFRSTDRVIAIGASTGGTEAIAEVMAAMPLAAPGVVIVQHLPLRFSESFAVRLDRESRIEVKVARDGDRVRPGLALLAPGERHMRVIRSGATYIVKLDETPPIGGHRPAVDALFDSTATAVGQAAVGVLLTGMGADGARGMLAMRRAGAVTIAQDEASCVVFGMPKEAIALGGAQQVLPLDQIARAALRAAA